MLLIAEGDGVNWELGAGVVSSSPASELRFFWAELRFHSFDPAHAHARLLGLGRWWPEAQRKVVNWQRADWWEGKGGPRSPALPAGKGAKRC